MKDCPFSLAAPAADACVEPAGALEVAAPVCSSDLPAALLNLLSFSVDGANPVPASVSSPSLGDLSFAEVSCPDLSSQHVVTHPVPDIFSVSSANLTNPALAIASPQLTLLVSAFAASGSLSTGSISPPYIDPITSIHPSRPSTFYSPNPFDPLLSCPSDGIPLSRLIVGSPVLSWDNPAILDKSCSSPLGGSVSSSPLARSPSPTLSCSDLVGLADRVLPGPTIPACLPGVPSLVIHSSMAQGLLSSSNVSFRP
ncbi:hypothetical protein NE237_015167 [Protea cynaroides]|uniref:Uncharacterized protein n=1 Tax=Protea cynaroides TaxID=273540 RepID=A0A9Q0KDQ3_9MAGN|nr:hypothetical protein NE237_015167 [Protea cynaroides]